MSRRAAGAALALALLLAGCGLIKQTIDPRTAQLERFKELATARQYAAIAEREVGCVDADAACRQLHLIKGDACFELARRGDAPPARYACAIAEIAAGLDGRLAQDTALGSNLPFAEKLLEALRARRDLSASTAESQPYTARLVQAARAFRATYPEQPAGYYYEASGLYGRVLDQIASHAGDGAVCAELDGILALLDAGAPARGRFSINFGRITRDVRTTRQAECVP